MSTEVNSDITHFSNLRILRLRERTDGTVWVCTDQGIYQVAPLSLTITKEISFPSDTDGKTDNRDNINGNYFRDIIEMKDGSIVAASEGGLVFINATTNDTIRYRNDPYDKSSLSHDALWTLGLDYSNNIWVGTSRGLDLFDPTEQTFTNYLPERLKNKSTSAYGLYAQNIAERPDHKLWAGFSSGLYIFDPEQKTFDLVQSTYCSALLQDQQNITWLGSLDGLFQITVPTKELKVYSPFGSTPSSGVASLVEDKEEQIWLLADAPHRDNYGLFRHNPDDETFLEYPDRMVNQGNDLLEGVREIAMDTKGTLWVASMAKLKSYNHENGAVKSFDLPIDPSALFIDSKGRIWIGEWSGLGLFDPSSRTYTPVGSIPNRHIHTIAEDSNSTFWIGTDRGLYRYNPASGKTERFTHNPNDKSSISNNSVYSVVIDKMGDIWLGTRGGLNKITSETKNRHPEFIQWRAANSDLPNDNIDLIIEGDNQTLWLCNGNNISHFSTTDHSFRTYNHIDGLPSSRFNRGMKSSKGRLYLGSSRGIISFHPDNLKDNSYIPSLIIDDLSIQNKPVPVKGSYEDTLSWETPLTRKIAYTDALELTYQQNDFSLEFTALNYISPENNQYKYKLEPYETDWVVASANNRMARYTNISPGEYTFRVIGSNNDGIWNEEGASLPLTILPPWWRTNWAYTLYTLLGIGLLYALRQFTIKRERLRHALELQTIESKKMRELDHLKSRFFANISHEFRTPLTLILGPLEKFIQQNDSHPSAQSTYRMMQRNAQRLLNLVNQLLDLSKLESGNMTLDTQPQAIVPFLKSIALAFTSLAEQRQIIYHFQFPTENPVVYYDADKLEKIVSNLLSNAFKFTPDGGQVTVSIILREAIQKSGLQTLKISVQDSGSGIPENIIEHIFDRFYQNDAWLADEQQGSGIGLSLVHELVELHQGEITVENTENSGALFTVTLPVKVADYEEITSNAASRNFPVIIPEEEILAEENGQSHSAYNMSKPLVLVIEDNADVRAFIRETLQPNYRLLEAANGKIGLQQAEETIPDLIISDVMMPEMDGVTLCQQLKTDERTSHVPVILLTAKASGSDKIIGLETGADDYIIKPFRSDELIARINNLIETRRKLRERYSQTVTLQPSDVAITSVDQQFLERMKTIVESHLADATFGVEAFSEEAGLSRVQLFRKLKALTDLSPSEFIKNMRLKRAADLLRLKGGTIGEIAFRVGFQDPSYFTKAFQKQYGQTPSDYMTETFKQ
ncbi:MAG: ATP-binding protein [Bacteroidota bacterium]